MATKYYPISICMAGAVSAGAYSAGAMSVLMKAIRDIENSELDLPHRPKHRLKIKGMSGASAGSIQAVLSSLDMFARNFSQDLGKKAWLDVTIDKLLSLDDLKGSESSAKSVLNAKGLKDVAADAISRHRWATSWPEFVDKEYELRLSITNLRGIPFNLKFPKTNSTDFGMSYHNEYLRYRFMEKRMDSGEYFVVQTTGDNYRDLQDLATGALASSAFPMAFCPIELDRPKLANSDIHDVSKWLKIQSVSKTDRPNQPPLYTVNYVGCKRPPDWNLDYGCKETIYAVDGGATNNEPLLEALKILLGDEISDWGELRDTEGRVLMIDPFPNEVDRKINDESIRIDKSLGSLVSALMGHARFSEPVMLSENLQNLVGLVYPSNPLRDGSAGGVKQLAIKSGALAGFGGFLKRNFLEHDYRLGELNMRRFMRYHFTLPADHNLFDGHSVAWKKYWQVEKNDELRIPILPIYQVDEKGDYKAFESNDKESYYKDGLRGFALRFDERDRELLKKKLKKRFSKVFGSLMNNHSPSSAKRYRTAQIGFIEKTVKRSKFVKWLGNKTVRFGWWAFGAGYLTNTVVETIENTLFEQGLLSYDIEAERTEANQKEN